MVWIVSRVFLAVIAHVGTSIIHPPNPSRVLLPHSDPLAHFWGWTSPWFRFDAGWYVGVVQHGYHWGALGVANTNFMPAYPALSRVVQPLTAGSPWAAALLVANLSYLVALIVFWRWARLQWSPQIALRAMLLFVAFPFSFFYVTPYAESLFVALAIAAFMFAEENRWPAAATAAGLSTIARPVGLAVVFGLLVWAVQQRNRRHILLACASTAPLLGFMAYLGLTVGHPFGFLTYHSAGWAPAGGGIFHTLGSQFHTSLSPFDRIDAACAALFLLNSVLVWRRLGLPYAAFVAAGVVLPLLHGLVSMERYVIVLFPAMAAWATWGGKIVQMLIFTVSALLLLLMTMLFTAGFSIW